MSTPDITRKIRALLDKAEATEFTFERDAFVAKAMAMMADHQITDAMLAADRPGADRRGEVVERQISLGAGPYVRARLALLEAVASAQCCRVVTWVTFEGRIGAIHGFASDADHVELLYTSLLVQATHAAAQLDVPRRTATTSVRRSFLFGFANEVRRRLHEAQTHAAATFEEARAGGETSQSVASVLADRRAEVDEYLADGRLGSLSGTKAPGVGYGEGTRAGRAADLGRAGESTGHGRVR